MSVTRDFLTRGLSYNQKGFEEAFNKAINELKKDVAQAHSEICRTYKEIYNDPQLLKNSTKDLVIVNRARARIYKDMIEEVAGLYCNLDCNSVKNAIEGCQTSCIPLIEDIELRSIEILSWLN